MKTKYYVLTEKKLRKYRPCESGLAFAQPHLPAALSSNPEENIELAIRLHDAAEPPGSRNWGEVADWVEWLKYTACPRIRADSVSMGYGDEAYNTVYDTAQRLAMIADELGR